MKYVNKTVFINYLSCPTLAWMTKRDILQKPRSLSSELLKFEAKSIRKLSLRLFPNAISAEELKLNNILSNVKESILNSNAETIYDVAFFSSNYLATVDILHGIGSNIWHLFMIKAGSRCKARYINDASFNTMILNKLDINIDKITILHLSSDYRLGMEISDFFKRIDCTEKVKVKSREFLSIYDKVLEDVMSESMPKPYLKMSCKNCRAFNICMGRDVKNHIFDLPKLSITAAKKLIFLKVDSIDKIPDDFELTGTQKIVKNCVLMNTIYISENLKSELSNIKQPFYYLDFESVSTIIPLYPNIAPHTQLLTQFSLDKTDRFGNILKHYEYIADYNKDFYRKIAEELIECVGKSGNIITYANTERIFILKLAEIFPDLYDKLNKIIERIVDLELIVRKNYYDPNFHGRSSIKKVLPVLIPNMNYSTLEINDGKDAAAAFAFIAMGFYSDERVYEMKKKLLKYCAYDTLAMICIHQFLINVVNKNK